MPAGKGIHSGEWTEIEKATQCGWLIEVGVRHRVKGLAAFRCPTRLSRPKSVRAMLGFLMPCLATFYHNVGTPSSDLHNLMQIHGGDTMLKNVASPDSPIFQRRQRRKDHYHQLDKTLIFAYPNLSDGAKLTYIVLDAYDWPDSTGESKGYVFPYQSTLAKVRNTSLSTIKRHLAELRDAGLITIDVITNSNGRRNVYWIEDISNEEFERYLEIMAKPQVNEGEVKNELTHGIKIELMGEVKNELHKDNKVKDNEVEGQDKTMSGQVLSVFESEIAVTAEDEESTTELPDDKTVERVDEVFTDVMNRPPTQSEHVHLVRLLTKYGPEDLETAIFELMVQRDQQRVQNPTRYLEGILDNWYREGRRTTDIVAHIRKLNGITKEIAAG